MKRVIVLVAPPDGPALTDRHIAAVSEALGPAGIALGAPDWLASGRAAEIPVEGDTPPTRESVAAALDGAAVDVAVLPAEGRRKALLVADMDSTIITVECIDELADFAGIKTEIAAVTERAMRGEIGFEEALAERVARLKGLSTDFLERAFAERVMLTPGARELVQTMRAHGAATVLVSGGFTFFAERVGRAAGFDEVRANDLEIDGNHLTGTVARPILGAEAKLATLTEKQRALGLESAATMAIGDGANDIPMIEAAGLGVAYRPKPKTAAAGHAVIHHGDLTAALFFQGYRAGEIVT